MMSLTFIAYMKQCLGLVAVLRQVQIEKHLEAALDVGLFNERLGMLPAPVPAPVFRTVTLVDGSRTRRM